MPWSGSKKAKENKVMDSNTREDEQGRKKMGQPKTNKTKIGQPIKVKLKI